MDLPTLCTTRLFDQNFGMCITPQDILVPFFCNNATNYYRPWKLCEEIAKKDLGSTIDNTENKFRISLDVQHFRPEEISVRVSDKEIIIEGKHAEKEDDHGFISRQFIRRYLLPKDCLSESLTSTLSSDGVLIVTVNKKICKEIKEVKTVPIQITGKTEKANSCEFKQDNRDVCEMKKDASVIKKEVSMMKSDQCEINKDACVMKNNTSGITKDQCEMKQDNCGMKKERCAMNKEMCEKQKGATQLKEEHSRLLKSELLGEAVSGTEKLLSESRKETDELLRLMSSVQAMPKPSEEKLDLAIGQCKAAMKELKKDVNADINMSGMESLTSSKMAIGSSCSNFRSSEISSTKSMISETLETSMSSSTKATREKTCDVVSEIICAELKEAATESI